MKQSSTAAQDAASPSLPPHSAARTRREAPAPVSGARFVVEELLRQGIEWVAGIPGGAILPLYDALADSGIRHVLARHEQGAGFIAQGASRVTGQVAVCLATSGPGATNLLTALADAKADSVPLVAITAQVPRALIGTDAFQEVDTVALARPITKACFAIESIEQLVELLPRAFALARSGRCGPVLIDVPKDVFKESVPDAGQAATAALAAPAAPAAHSEAAPRDTAPHEAAPRPLAARALEVPARPKLSPEAEGNLAHLANLLAKSERPLLYVGGGVHRAAACRELLALVNHNDVPVVSSLHGLGALPASDPRWFGMLGMHGAAYTNLATDEADLVIAVGARFDDRATGEPTSFCRNARIAHIDVDPREIGKIKPVDVGIVADARVALDVLRSLVPKARRSGWRARLEALRTAAPFVQDGCALGVIAALSRALPEDGVITTDVGQHQMWVAQAMPFSHTRTLLTSGGLGTMGFGLPAAIGAALAQPGRSVTCVTGDGSFLMNIQELALLAELEVDVKVVILNNQQLGMVRQQQDVFYERRYSASQFQRGPDFAAIARGFGVAAERLSADEFCRSAERWLQAPGSLVLDVDVGGADDVWPMVPPGASNVNMLRPGGAR